MTRADSYGALSRMIDYPAEKSVLQSDCTMVSSFMKQQKMNCQSLSAFADFAERATLAALQEEYVATFDFNPATAPYLGHHLFGDNQKKGGYMIMLKQEYQRCGYSPEGVELPDHLSVVLGFLSCLSRQDSSLPRQKFIADCVLPGVVRLHTAFGDRQDSPWKTLVETARLLCAADCQEVQPC